MEGNYNLDKFDLNKLVKNNDGESINPRIAIIAKSGSGKSFVIRDIMNHFYKTNLPCGIVVAPTDRVNKFYNDFVPECFIYHKWKNFILPRFFERQRRKMKENEQRIAKGKKPIDVRAFLIMDDCMSSKKEWLKSDYILSIFNEGRHFQLCPFILSMQYCLGIEPELRNNFDFIFLLGEDIHESRVKIYKHYAGIFPSFSEFSQVFSQVTNNYGCMVIDNRLRCTDIEKKVFWFRSNVPSKFKLGVTKTLKFNEKRYDKNHDELEPIMDLNGLCKKKNLIKVKLNE